MLRSSLAVMGLLAGIGAGCTSSPPPEPYDRSTERWAAEDTLPSDAPEGHPLGEEHAAARTVVIGNSILYPVQWGRAEELAITLAPVVESIYGPGARVVAYPPTNHLIIHLPPGAKASGDTPEAQR